MKGDDGSDGLLKCSVGSAEEERENREVGGGGLWENEFKESGF